MTIINCLILCPETKMCLNKNETKKSEKMKILTWNQVKFLITKEELLDEF